MIILGIDPGLATTGYGVVNFDLQSKTAKLVLEAYGCVVTDKNINEPQRLVQLYKGVKKLLEQFQPDVLTIERLFFFRNAKTVISVGQARGVVFASAQKKVEVFEYAPLQVKAVITGNGRAKKKEVEQSVKQLLKKRKLILRKEDKTKDGHHIDDAVDALAVAICHSIKITEK